LDLELYTSDSKKYHSNLLWPKAKPDQVPEANLHKFCSELMQKQQCNRFGGFIGLFAFVGICLD
jgi:hypothetical protein